MNHPIQYDAESIKTHQGLEAIRNRPQFYIDDLEDPGITRTVLEIITNSVDEMLVSQTHAELNIYLFYDENQKRTQFLVEDGGRGIPILTRKDGSNSFYSCMTVPHTSGKFDQSTYSVSGGQFGVGSKVTVATARQFTAISFRPEGIGFIHVKEGIPPEKPTLLLNHPCHKTGVTCFWEPDHTMFFTAGEYGKEGYIGLLSMLRQLVFFNKLNIKFYGCDHLIPECLWSNTDPSVLEKELKVIREQSRIIWDANTENSEEWIKSYWGVHRNFTWSKQISFDESRDRKICNQSDPTISERIVDIVLKFYYLKGDRNGGYFSLVNRVPIVDWKRSEQTKVVLEVLRKCISDRIPNENIKKWFLSQYTLPLFLAASVDYKGFQASGATKNAWICPPFRLVYKELVTFWFEKDEHGKSLVDEYFALIYPDIESRYQDSLGRQITTKDNMSLRALLGDRSKRFFDAEPKDGNRANCEIFLLEGNSTGGGEGYDTEHQGLYFMQGKPRNIIKGTNGNFTEALERMLNNEVLKDIFNVLKFDPRKKDLSQLHFGRVCITPDADAHGGHIAALLLTAFQRLAPELVNIPGFFQIIVPPYYRICFGKNMSHQVYMRQKKDLPLWCAKNIFIDRLTIKARYRSHLNLPDKVLGKEEYITLTDLLFQYGLLMDNVSSRLQIHPGILEALCYCTHYLSPETMDLDVIKHYLRTDKVVYHKETNTLTVTYAEEDIPIPLLFIKEELYGPVLNSLNRMGWRYWSPCITTLKNDSYKDTVVSFYRLYSILKMWRDKLITIKPLKGLGSMDSKDLTKTCMDVRQRKAIIVRGIGDVERIVRLMERDTAERKKIASIYINSDN